MVDEPTTGVFDAIAGAKSRDPDLEHVVDDGATTADVSTQTPVGESGPPKGEEAPKLKARIAQLERQLGELDGWAQLGVAVGQTDEGKQVIDRWQKGEALFAQQVAASGGTPEAPLTMTALQAELNRRDAGKRQMDDLNEVANDNLPEFKKISKSPVYAGKLDATLQAVWNGSIPVADEAINWADQVKAKNYTAMKEAYEWYLKGNTKVVKAAKAAGKAEADERNKAALAGEHTSSSISDSTEEPPPQTEEEQMIDRMVNAHGLGRSFGSVGRPK